MRRDQWTTTEDNKLVQIWCSHVSKGKTQLTAFDVAGRELDRTGAACGYRFNSFLRHSTIYKSAIRKAKDTRIEKSNEKRKQDYKDRNESKKASSISVGQLETTNLYTSTTASSITAQAPMIHTSRFTPLEPVVVKYSTTFGVAELKALRNLLNKQEKLDPKLDRLLHDLKNMPLG